MRDIFTELAAPELSDPDPTRRAQIQMKQPLPKRFYKDVTIRAAEGGHEILLDGRPVKTPKKQALLLPTEAAARLVAEEWERQVEVIDPLSMPVTRLSNTAIDGIAQELDAVHQDIVKYSGTDLLCYRADSPEGLVALQAEQWDPVLYWLAESKNARFILAEGIIHRDQPEQAIASFDRALAAHRDAFRLASLHVVTTLTGSAMLALAFAEGRLTDAEVWQAAHVDEDWQIRQWGEDAEATARRAKRWTEMQAAAHLFAAVAKSD